MKDESFDKPKTAKKRTRGHRNKSYGGPWQELKIEE
jgi:hypothetical protein